MSFDSGSSQPHLNFILSVTDIQSKGLVQSVSDFFENILIAAEQYGIDLEKSILVIETDESYLREIIKLRAIRLIWENILSSRGLDFEKSMICGQITSFHYSKNVNKNKIKAASMAVAALTGGVGSLEILPSNGAWTDENRFERRIARNIHHLLHFESHLNHVPDAVRGSYFFEKVTRELVERVWQKLTS